MNLYDFYITPDEYEQAAKNGIRPALLEVRIRSLGWPKSKAINTPPHKKKRLSSNWIKLAEQNGICYSTFKHRVNQLGWDPERAATQPLQDRRAQAKYAYERSRKYPAQYLELARQNGINERTFHRRIKSGWDIEKAATRPPMTGRECGLLTKEKREKELQFIFQSKKFKR
ncbi:hypothetical protein DNHGIG_25600 [Collibacillus ludicampi]|uniref:Uncharacterized protein n=1 Tax=Collibacillus ludicampi TaxID=2771369 RepID=A0AAV4LGP7_9BACL|nr:hypothetical protein [Collibacillus ludicampi]GIM47011.1 hypothetical protein DNHGIG_25600 [Collibacillus ludicampi]